MEETRKATSEAHRQTEAAIRQVNIATEIEQRQLRAYLYFEKVQIQKQREDGIPVDITIKNSGLTPAYHVEIISMNSFVPYPFTKGEVPVTLGQSPVTMRLLGYTKNSLVISPGKEKGMMIENSIDRKLQQDFKRKKMAHVFYGAMYYDDAFNFPHFTKYCYYLLNDNAGTAVNCKDGNDSN